MTALPGSGQSNIPLIKIDLEDRRYKLSRNTVNEELKRSIRACGIIDPPLLLLKGGRYIIVTGHNRISAAAGLGIREIRSTVTESLDYETFVSGATLKCYRRETGPVGRSKLIIIIRNEFNPGQETLSELVKKTGLPAEFINDPGLPERIINLPEGLRDYIDYKDINIKTVKNLLRLPDEAILKLNEWISHLTMRANIFKNIIEYLIDINKKSGSLKTVCDFDITSIDDRRLREVHLHDRLFELRYPQYSELKEKAEAVIEYLNGRGIKIDFHEYFEGDEIILKLPVNKREDLKLAQERIKNINIDDIKKLLELL